MLHSESIAKLAPALVAAQREFRAIGKDAANPEFRSAYATLDKIVEAVRPILAQNGLCVVQGAGPSDAANTLVVQTRIIHTSGEWIESAVIMPLVGRMLKGGERAAPDPQSGGSAVSYGRRYGLCAALGLVTGEDDDGNAAARPAKRSAAPRPEPATSSNGEHAPYTGLPASRPMPFGKTKGTPLGEHSVEALQKVKMWCLEKDDPKFGPLVKDINAVLTDKALGDDKRVANMHAAVAAEDSGLPF